MTLVISSLSEWQALRKTFPKDQRVGLVPTMGNLHAGHASLLNKARNNNDITVLSLFVNPTQFNDSSDYHRYPKTLSDDQNIARTQGIDYLFLPDEKAIYPDQYAYRVSENVLGLLMEGEHRPGHFEGMLTVVMKLFLLTKPHRVYFGEKDFQQLQLIKGLVKAFFMDIEVVGCATVREPSGLAMSSRNQFLSHSEKSLAALFPQLLASSTDPRIITTRLTDAGFRVEYVQRYGDRMLGAVRLGTVRLIDNIQLYNL